MSKQRLSASGVALKDAEKHDVHESKVDSAIVSIGANVTCLPCYGAEDVPSQCCNTCEEVRAKEERRGARLSELRGLPGPQDS